MSGGWENYFIPGTKVLKNRLGLDDAEELRILEEKLVFLRMTELDSAPAPTDQFMIKAGHAYYPAGPEMTKAAEKLFAGLAKDNFLRGLGFDDFVAKLAELWGELNVVHSFREGNTRTQTVFFDALVTAAGYQLRALSQSGHWR